MASNAKTNSKRWPLIIAVVTLVIAAGVTFWVLQPKKDTTAVIPTEQVERHNVRKVVAATGKVVSNFEVEIKAKASGEIIRLPYDVSDSVQKGDLLVQLNPVDENRAVSQAEASLSGVQNKMEQSRLNLQVARRTLDTDIARANADLSAAHAKQKDAASKSNRAAELVQNRYISQEEYETAISTAAQAKTDLANAKIRLQELQTQKIALNAQAKDVAITAADARNQSIALATTQQRLSETRIYAPISGVITSRTGQIGQIVSSGISNVGGGTAIMTLADLSHIFVLASVDESDIGQVREGQHVDITADAYPGTTFNGKVVRIAPKGLEETNVITFEVKIEVVGANKNLLMPEMTANVEIVLAEKPNALSVPVEAIRNKNGKTFVKIKTDEGNKKFRFQRVTTGINDGTNVEITSGLTGGEQVVVGKSQIQSHWRKDQQKGAGGNNRRGQMMMMRGLGGGGGRR